MFRWRVLLSSLLIGALPALAACGSGGGSEGGDPFADAGGWVMPPLADISHGGGHDVYQPPDIRPDVQTEDTGAPLDGATVDTHTADVPRPRDIPAPDQSGGRDVAVRPDAGCPSDGVGCPCQIDADCLAWDDGDLCNGYLTCRSGACMEDPRTVVTCPAGETCSGPSTCDPTTGTCAHTNPAPDGTACDDGDACTGGDACGGGVCRPGTDDLCAGGGCEPAQAVVCNGSYSAVTSGFAGRELIDSYSCAAGDFSGPEISYTFSVTSEKLVEFDLDAGPGFRLMLLPGDDDCRPGSCLEATDNKLERRIDAGESLFVVVDGAPPGGVAALHVRCWDRGAEICDNGRDDDWDGDEDCDDPDCDSEPVCIPRVCSDDICHPTDEDCESCPQDCGPCSVCPDHVCTEGYEDCESCPDDCGACPFCGDGTCDPDESCETCEEDCDPCPSLPCVDEPASCGTVTGADLQSDNDLSDYSCGGISGDNEDRTHLLRVDRPGTVTVTLAADGGCDDYDLYVVEGCDAQACLDRSTTSSCSEQISFDAVPGVDYVIAVEVYSGSREAGYTLEIDCP